MSVMPSAVVEVPIAGICRSTAAGPAANRHHAIAREQLLHGVESLFLLARRVLEDHLDLASAEHAALAVDLVHGQLDAAPDRDAILRNRPAQPLDRSDLDRLL